MCSNSLSFFVCELEYLVLNANSVWGKNSCPYYVRGGGTKGLLSIFGVGVHKKSKVLTSPLHQLPINNEHSLILFLF